MAFRLLSAIGSGETAPGKKFSVVIKRPAAKTEISKNAQLDTGATLPAIFSALAVLVGLALVYYAFEFHANYVLSFRSPVVLHFQLPVVIAHRETTPVASKAQSDQHKSLTPYQEYACAKFGSACRVALAIQRAENPQGKCEIYHYNGDGTLDWGYFQINTVHLKRRGVNLRDLLDCKANVDFAYKLYTEEGGFSAWSTFRSGLYLRYLRRER